MSIQRKITCYHGTSKANADKIVKEHLFFQSDKENEWLGRGIYFFGEKEDAHWWNSHSRFDGQEMEILEVELVCDESDILDLDDRATFLEVNNLVGEMLRSTPANGVNLENKSKHQRQCFFCNYVQTLVPQIKIRTYTFSTPFYKNNLTDFGFSKKQKQYCVVDHEVIKTVNGKNWR